MKKKKNYLIGLSICLIMLFLSSCSTTVNYLYVVQKPPVIEKSVNVNTQINFSVVDNRLDKRYIGYMDNIYGMRVRKIKPADPDITKTISDKFKEELAKKGFNLNDNLGEDDLKLTFSITTFLGEMRPGLIDLVTTADCGILITLTSTNTNTEIYSTTVYGKGEKRTPMVAGKKDIPEALSFALDDALNKILNETQLIDKINSYSK